MDEKPSLDERTSFFLSRLSQQSSRRGLLNKMGTWALRITGLSLTAVVLPVDRAQAQFGCNGDWQLCNMHGNFCKPCCGSSSPSYNTCPSCTNQGTFWTGCCTQDNCTGVRIRYYDCCDYFWNSGSLECKGDRCGKGYGNCPADWPAYCSALQEFRCTIIVNTGESCTGFDSHCH